MGLKQDNDIDSLKQVVQKIIDENQKQAQDFKEGKDTLMKFFVGQAMKETRGSGNPQVLAELFKEMI